MGDEGGFHHLCLPGPLSMAAHSQGEVAQLCHHCQASAPPAMEANAAPTLPVSAPSSQTCLSL